ncbi:tetratricopeptide repeat protein [Vibrio renipiscarius]|uniref:tetratricopeptide repeat protein n=1 Tax=Vibrio renipiscarius TaxID=1461322 RepID=UPI0035516E35
MSAINNALSELAKAQTISASSIEKVHVPTIKQKPRWPWLIAGFSLSLAMGGWAMSQQERAFQQDDVIQPHQQSAVTSESALAQVAPLPLPLPLPSPTAKVTSASDTIYSAPAPIRLPLPEVVDVAPQVSVQASIAQPTTTQQSESSLSSRASSPSLKPDDAPRFIANVSKPNASESLSEVSASPTTDRADGVVVVEQVELTPTQLARKAQDRGKKALDANNLADAIEHYNDALRYAPRDSQIRQKLAALYYGKGEVRKAVDLLQKGIAIDHDDMDVRLALSKLLIKEKQNAAALTPLVHLPANPHLDYLSLRAALAQKNNQNALAQESYQQLVAIEPENGRWWLGYGIQLERGFKLPEAKSAYQQALNKVGLSSSSQQFIRDRLNVLSTLEEQSNAN